MVVGADLGWVRLRFESVWPAALAYDAFNAAGSSYMIFAPPPSHRPLRHAPRRDTL